MYTSTTIFPNLFNTHKKRGGAWYLMSHELLLSTLAQGNNHACDLKYGRRSVYIIYVFGSVTLRNLIIL